MLTQPVARLYPTISCSLRQHVQKADKYIFSLVEVSKNRLIEYIFITRVQLSHVLNEQP